MRILVVLGGRFGNPFISQAGKPQYVPITSIGREWYNTHGSVDIILDKSQRVDFFYQNTKENEIEGAACDIKG